MPARCDRCNATLDRLAVCEACGHHMRLGPGERIASLTPSFDEQDAGLGAGDPLAFPGYRDALADAREGARSAESTVWGWAEIGGTRCALLIGDFSFLGGSMGIAAGEKIARAFDAARDHRLPLVAVTASGGARMQEGMVALAQMVKTAEARRRHAAARLGQVTVLTSPTMGGVYASFAPLADLICAEPHASIGFAGPRVVEELTGTLPDPHVHDATFALEHGLIDAVVHRHDVGSWLGRALRGVRGAESQPPAADPGAARAAPDPFPVDPAPDAHRELELARHPARPRARAILDALCEDAVELTGDRQGADDPGVVAQLGVLLTTGRRIVAVGQDVSGDGRIRPAGFRKVVRAVEMAGRLGLPVLTLIDTRGADPLAASEGGGLSAAIAQTLVAMLDCPTPTLAVVTGEGGSGGAIALAPTDRVLVWEHAVFSVIAPEGAASILYRDGSRAPELAAQLGITAHDLVRLGIGDRIVPEPEGGAHTAPQAAVETLAAEVARELEAVAALPKASRLARRRARWRQIGNRWLVEG